MLSEAKCPFCERITTLRHVESHNSDCTVKEHCQHAKSYEYDCAELVVIFID